MKKKLETVLLASTPVSLGLANMEKMIEKYLYGTKILLTEKENTQGVWDVATNKKELPHYRVIKKGKRLRFERIVNSKPREAKC